MRLATRRSALVILSCLAWWPALPCTLAAQEPPVPPRPQNPSPMVERTRTHERVPEQQLPGVRFVLDDLLARPVHVFVPAGVEPGNASLLVHFHGAAYVAEHAVSAVGTPWVLAVVNLGAGTGVYERAFSDAAVFDTLLDAIAGRLGADDAAAPAWDRLVVSAYSAGHGAVRALLREPNVAARIAGALLLDGIHTGYVPQGTVLHEGGRLDATGLEPYVELGRAAMRGDRAVLITHSAVFPGTFASTTETVDYLLDALDLPRTAVLRWGPVGMQQLSEVRSGRLLVQGFAGNSAPDHADHLHGMAAFLRLLTER
jgi:hypothetical protein